MNFEIHTYGNAEFIRLVFNYVSMIFSDNDFGVLANIVALLGFIAVMGKAAFNKDGLNVFRTHFALVFLILIAYVPKTTVVITDDVVPANSSIVGNVPLGLAATAGFFSSVGYWLTDAYETVTAVPSYARTTTSGFLFHQEVFKRANSIGLMNDIDKFNFDQFVSSCVVVDGIGHGRFSYEDLRKSTNPADFLSANLSDADVSQFYYRPPGSSMTADQQATTCKTGFDQIIRPAIQSGILMSYSNIALRFTDNFDTNHNATMNILPKVFTVVQEMLGGSGTSISFPEYAERQIIFNEMDKSIAMFATGVGAEEASQYILQKANVNRQLTYSMTKELATQKLPKLKMIIEGIIYGIFPIVALLAILAPVKVLVSYAKVLLWISLWPVMFALLNSIIVHYDQKNLNAIVQFYSGYSSDAMMEINKYLAENGNITAGLMIALPMLTWLLISSGGTMLSSLSGKVLGGMEKDVESATKEVVEGQGRYAGNDWQMVATQNESVANNSNNGISVTSIGESGSSMNTTTSAMGDTRHSMNANSSQGLMSFTRTEEFTEKAAVQHQEAVSLAQTHQQTLSNRTDAVFGLVQSHNSQWSEGESRTAQDSFSQSSIASEQKSAVTESVTQFAHQQNLTETDTAALMGKVGGQLGLSMGGSGAALGGQASTGTSTTTNDIESKFEQFKTSEQGQSLRQKIENSMQSETYAQKYGYDESFQDQIRAASSVAQSAARDYNNALQQVEKETLNQEEMVAFSNKSSSEMASYIVNNTGITMQEYEQLDIRAYNGDQDARDQIYDLLSDSFKVSSKEDINTQYEDKSMVMFGEGSAIVDTVYQDNLESTLGEAKKFSDKVENKASESGVLPGGIESKIQEDIPNVAVSDGEVGARNAGMSQQGQVKGDGNYSPSVVANTYDGFKENFTETANVVGEKANEVVVDAASDAVIATKNAVSDPVGTVDDASKSAFATTFTLGTVAFLGAKDFTEQVFTKVDEKEENSK